MAILWNLNYGYIVERKLWLYCGTQIMAILWNANYGYIVEPKLWLYCGT